MKAAASLLACALASCAGNTAPPPQAAPDPPPSWRSVATDHDIKRLREWRTTFVNAIADARRAGHGAEIDREGTLLQPDAALGGPIPDGTYKCRVIKVGAQTEGMLDYIGYPAFTCVVSTAADRQLVKRTGSQRQVGTIYTGGQLRDVFLGTLVLGDETRAFRYGTDQTRDVAGFIERIGDRRWRLIMPQPHYESQLDVLELVPAN